MSVSDDNHVDVNGTHYLLTADPSKRSVSNVGVALVLDRLQRSLDREFVWVRPLSCSFQDEELREQREAGKSADKRRC